MVDGKPWTVGSHYTTISWNSDNIHVNAMGLSSTGKGILIGMLSAFGSAAFVAFIMALIYFFRWTNRGRIFLDSIGRPGEYDDEQAFLREEEDALENMDDLQRAEYLRAKGNQPNVHSHTTITDLVRCSFRHGESSRVRSNRHFAFAIPGNSREGCTSLGVRTRAGDRKLLCRRPYRDRVLRCRVQCSEQSACAQTERGLLLGSKNLRQTRQHIDQHWHDYKTLSSFPTPWYVATALPTAVP
jgi:hypothetical protein